MRPRVNPVERLRHPPCPGLSHVLQGRRSFKRATWLKKNRREPSVRALAAYAEANLRERLANCSERPAISAETKKGIVKRVTPKLVAEFSNVDKLPLLISLELEILAAV